MSRAGEGFEVEPHLDPTRRTRFDLTYQGRAVAYDLDDMTEVQSYVARWIRTGRAPAGATVTLVHPDGYREVVRR